MTRTIAASACQRRHKRTSRVIRLLSPGVFVVSMALIASGCLSTGYAYLSHRSPDGFDLTFKVPAHWKEFNEDQIIEATNPNLSRSQLSAIEGSRWLVSFTPTPHAKAKDAGTYSGSYPMGVAYSRELSPTERDSYSLSSLRTEVLQQDPLSAGSPDRVLSYSEFTGQGGLRGSRLVVDLPANGGKVLTFAQVAAVDAQTNWVFVLAIGCTATCWRPNAGIIKQVLNSWNIRQVGR